MKASAEFARRVLEAHPEGLTRLEAMQHGIGNMPGRALDMREAGLPITDRWEHTPAGALIKRWFLLPSPVAAPLRGVQASFDLQVSPSALPLSGGRAVPDAEGASTAVTGR